MRHSLASAWFTAVLLATLVVSIDATAQAHNRHCSDANVIGRWGFTTEGTILGVGDVAAVGIVAFDSKVRTAELSFAILNNGREVRALFRSLVLPNGVSLLNVITIEAKRLFPRSRDED